VTRRSLCNLMALPGLVRCLKGAVRGDEAMYVGGTISSVREKTEGHLDLSSETEGRFEAKKGTFTFAYKKITSIEYGQKAGRRIGVALVVSPLFLLSKKRKHFLTIGFTDAAGKSQGAVLEVGKGHVRSVLSTLEARSGQKVEFESEEARKHAGN